MHGRIRNVLEGMHVAQRQTQSSWLPGAAAVTDSSLPSSDDCVVCSHRPVIWMVGFIPIFALVFGQVELRVRQLPLRRVAVPALWPDASSFRFAGLDDMRASVIESEIADRTRRLRFCNSIDSTRASFTAAIRPATTATVPPDLSDDPAAESGARKQSLSRYCRVSSQCNAKGGKLQEKRQSSGRMVRDKQLTLGRYVPVRSRSIVSDQLFAMVADPESSSCWRRGR